MNAVYFGDNLEVLRGMPTSSVSLIYIDPPFNTGITQTLTQLKVKEAKGDVVGNRKGYGGKSYASEEVATMRYEDKFEDLPTFLRPRLEEAYRVLSPNGSMYFHIDYREVHYCKILLDTIFGRDCFLNEIIWAYDYGGRAKTRWPAKHDNILFYVKDPKSYTFNYDKMDRLPYMAPGLVGKEKAERGKTPTDVWWHTIVPPGGKERTGYPTQKPLGIIRRILSISSNPGDTVMDFFAGSGTIGEAAIELGRHFILVDNNPEAIETMKRRLSGKAEIMWHEEDSAQ